MPTTIYKVNGKRVPSVTTVLGKYKDPSGLLFWAWNEGIEGRDFRQTRDKAAGLGTVVHAMIDDDIHGRNTSLEDHLTPERMAELGDMEESDIVARTTSGFDAYKQWRDGSKLEIVETERSMVSYEHAFGGTPDAIGIVNGSLCLLDWKTSNKIYPDYIKQLAAYVHLYENGEYLDDASNLPPRGPIQSVHLLRVGKDYGDFHHHFWPLPVIEMAWKSFKHLRGCYDIDSKLKKVV